MRKVIFSTKCCGMRPDVGEYKNSRTSGAGLIDTDINPFVYLYHNISNGGIDMERNSDIMITIGGRLRARRRQHGYSQECVSEKADLPPGKAQGPQNANLPPALPDHQGHE